MNQLKSENETINPDERELIVAYLSYALDDVRAVSDIGLHLLQMTRRIRTRKRPPFPATEVFPSAFPAVGRAASQRARPSSRRKSGCPGPAVCALRLSRNIAA
jgi:hypothetical protein